MYFQAAPCQIPTIRKTMTFAMQIGRARAVSSPKVFFYTFLDVTTLLNAETG